MRLFAVLLRNYVRRAYTLDNPVLTPVLRVGTSGPVGSRLLRPQRGINVPLSIGVTTDGRK
ncbi:hypothetical protein D3C78_1496310 [compost metagenome]